MGEKIEVRKAGQLAAVLTRQLEAGLADVPEEAAGQRIVIAYEPVWAIGTGLVAGPKEIAEAHAFVRKKLVERFPDAGRSVRILYGGSVKAGNAKELFGQPDIDGGLIGGASLVAADFLAIHAAA